VIPRLTATRQRSAQALPPRRCAFFNCAGFSYHPGMLKNAALTDAELELSPLQWHALAKLADKAKQFRRDVPVAKEQPVNFVIRVCGHLDVADFTTYQVKSKPDAEQLLGIALAELGPKTRDKVVAKLLEQGRSETPDGLTDEVRAVVTSVVSRLTTTAAQERSGAISGSVSAELIGSKSGGR
jgi:hypothetical protein